jgi:hypothetical protein
MSGGNRHEVFRPNQPFQRTGGPRRCLPSDVSPGRPPLNFFVQRRQFRILKRLFAFQNNQRLLGYRPTSELRSCTLRANPPMFASRCLQRAPGRHPDFNSALGVARFGLIDPRQPPALAVPRPLRLLLSKRVSPSGAEWSSLAASHSGADTRRSHGFDLGLLCILSPWTRTRIVRHAEEGSKLRRGSGSSFWRLFAGRGGGLGSRGLLADPGRCIFVLFGVPTVAIRHGRDSPPLPDVVRHTNSADERRSHDAPQSRISKAGFFPTCRFTETNPARSRAPSAR